MSDWAGTRCKVQVIVPMTSGVAADAVSNTWYIANDGNVPITGAYQTAIDNAFKDFYKTVGASMSVDVDFTKVQLKFIDMDGPKPQYPFWTATVDATPSSPPATAGPSEVAMCLSYHAPYTSGVKHARRQGRVFIGPLGSGVVAADRPGHGLATTLITAGNTLRDAIAAVNASYMLAQHSTKSVQLNGPLTFWCDNAWDTQRRRGLKKTVTWTS